jgi:hypothetical protein
MSILMFLIFTPRLSRLINIANISPYSLYNSGDIVPPCLTPYVVENGAEK